MVHINLTDILGLDENQIAAKIQQGGPDLRLTMSVAEQYAANSKTDLADNWLKTWYIAESLAAHSSKCECKFEGRDDGTGEFEFRFTVSNTTGIAKVIAEFSPVFDPDDLEAGALIYEDAHEWLASRGEVHARFPDIEESYRGEAAVATEDEGYMQGGDEDDMDDPSEGE